MKKHEYNILPEMNQEQYLELKNDIIENGYDDRYPIWLYENDIIDGWNRHKICDELQITPNYETFTGTTLQAVQFVLRSNNRRDLSSIQRACVTVELQPIIDLLEAEVEKERREKQAATLTETLKSGVKDKKLSQTKEAHENDTNTKLAKLKGTNRTYIAKAKKLKNENPEMFEKLKKGEVKIGKTNISQLFTGENEWYTPKKYIDLVTQVMGSIDTDPCSSADANQIIQAKTYYTIETNGLDKDWLGNIFMNPPFSSKEINAFTDKLCKEYQLGHITEGIIVTNDNTDTKWFKKVNKISALICFTTGRIKFYNKDKVSSPTCGQVFFYIGKNENNFIQHFQNVGLIMRKI